MAACIVAMCGCTANDETDETNQLVDLNVSTSIERTRAASSGVIISDFFNVETVIAVYAHSEKTNNTSNNHAKFKCSAATSSSVNTWGYEGSDKIQLSAEAATIYAIYPSTLTVTTASTAISSSTTASGLQVLTGSSDVENTRITAEKSYSSQINITAASGETDYMYATDADNTSAQPKANNGKATAEADKDLKNTVNLKMNHAMAMVSFKVYNDGTYTNSGSLTKIQLTNATETKVIKTGTATMLIGTPGTITPQDGSTGITRYIYTKGDSNSTAGYTLLTNSTAPTNNPAFSMLVYPITTNITANSIKAIFTVDGNDYPVTIPADSNQKWEAGKNYIYTVKLNGKDLGVGNVSIVSWAESPIDDELQPVK